MCVSFSFSATPFELLKVQSLCLEQVTQMKESLKRKKGVIFLVTHYHSGPNYSFSQRLLSPPFLLLHLDSCLL